MLFKMSNEGERKTQGKKKCAHKTHPHTYLRMYIRYKAHKIQNTCYDKNKSNEKQATNKWRKKTTTESTNIYYEDNNIS